MAEGARDAQYPRRALAGSASLATGIMGLGVSPTECMGRDVGG